MHRKKHSVYRYYPRSQAFTGGLGMCPSWVRAMTVIKGPPMFTITFTIFLKHSRRLFAFPANGRDEALHFSLAESRPFAGRSEQYPEAENPAHCQACTQYLHPCHAYAAPGSSMCFAFFTWITSFHPRTLWGVVFIVFYT